MDRSPTNGDLASSLRDVARMFSIVYCTCVSWIWSKDHGQTTAPAAH
ncbi:MAG TPA: hypothetical protein VMT29_02465 [Steroidobacteraceae bacterium]|nr:hypothetical protein [Steroidobacteraceae bacterium]